MEKLQVVDYSGPYLELKRLVEDVWQAVLEQRFDDAADGAGWTQLDATFTRARAALKKARGER